MNPLFYWIVNTPGVGGAIAMGVLGGATLLYLGLTRWILQGGRQKQEDKPDRAAR